jgi:hypothetical protein
MDGKPIYIGKAVNLRDRVKNHFLQPTYKDHFFTGITEKIGYLETGSEIEALVLEASLIKKYQPKFNSVWRDDKNYFYVAVSKSSRPMVYITHQKNDGKTDYIGSFVEGDALKKTLKYLRRVFPFYTIATHPKNACTWCHLGLCPGSAPDLAVYKENIKKLKLILQGKRKTVLYALRKEMAAFSNSKAILDFFSSLNGPIFLIKYRTAVFSPAKEKSKFLLWSMGRGRAKEKLIFSGSLSPRARGALPLGPSACETPRKDCFSSALAFSANFEIPGPPG